MSQETEAGQAAAIRGRSSGADLSRMILGGRSFSGGERNCVFLNTGASPAAAGRFANISVISGLDYPDDGRALALSDWDHDGDVDLWISNRNAPRLRLMRNEASSDNQHLSLRLQGSGTTSNRDAIGARVEVVVANPEPGHPPRKSIQTVRAGEGFLSQSSKWLHFGLGRNAAIDKARVLWPDGRLEEFTGLEVDHRYRLVQGTGMSFDMTEPPRAIELEASIQVPLAASDTARIPMVELLEVARSPYRDLEGEEQTLPVTTENKMLLVNLWASWCAPCLVELDEFARRHEELRASGIDVLALSVEAVEPGAAEEARAKAARVVANRELPFTVGLATEPLLADLQELHDRQIALRLPLPLPSSFLIDSQGRLAAIYKGPVSVDQLLDDALIRDGDRAERFVRAAPMSGRTLSHPQPARAAARWSEELLLDRAAHLEQTGRLEDAARQYSSLLEAEPDSFLGHNGFGHVLLALGREAKAMQHLRRALEIKPKDALAQLHMGSTLLDQGDAEGAISHFRAALRVEPDLAEAHAGLGSALQAEGINEDATNHFRQAIDHGLNTADAHIRLGIALYRQEKTAEATELFRQAVRLQSDYGVAHSNLGLALQKQGEIDEAITHFQHALRLDPDNAGAHARLGALLTTRGDAAAAVRHLTRALELEPDSPETMNNLAWIRATHPEEAVRDGAQAVELAERCCQLTGNRVAATLDTLAAAYAEAGRFGDAIDAIERAISLTPPGDQAGQRIRLELYRAGEPFRE